MRTNQIILIIATLLIALCSCQDDCSKADKLRLQNKFEEAAELYQKAADQGNAYAMWRLSGAYSNGDGVDFDENKAAELLIQAAEKGCEEAKCDLAFAYMFEWYADIEKNADKGKDLLEKLYKKTESSHVLSRYASLLFFGPEPFEEDKEKAMSILEKVKDKNNPFYLELMGYVYLNGTDKIDIDENKAEEYFEKAFKQGRRYCAFEIAKLYDLNAKNDKSKMIEWLDQGIASNETNCMLGMARLYCSEDTSYSDIHNSKKGIELIKKATKHGSADAFDMLGQQYFSGQNTQKDDQKAFDCYEKAYELKSGQGAFHLGYCFIDGIGVEKNIVKGIEIWKDAVEFGDGGAANNLFCYYNQGMWGGKINKEQAKYYLKKAADLGDIMGCLNLGREYFLGNNLFKKDNSQAFVYILNSAAL